MADTAQLPHLLRLIDDDSPAARREIARALAAFGQSLPERLAELSAPPTEDQRRQIDSLMQERARELLRSAWAGWLAIEDDKQRLEAALEVLAAYLAGPLRSVDLAKLLDDLADAYRASHPAADPRLLAEFLFEKRGIRGAADDYYRPENSSLVYAVERKRGIPITLACLFILMGRRLGLEIEGCNFPGHFLALAKTGGETRVVDCFDGGRFLTQEDFAEAGGTAKAIQAALSLQAGSEEIVARVLRNLHAAFTRVGRENDARLMTELLQSLGEAA